LKIAVVIAAYNLEPWIDICFSGLYERPDVQIIVVDNCSCDNSVSLIEKNYSSIIVIKNERNLGFGGANNIGIAKALELGSDFVLLLNQDAHLVGICLDVLLEIATKEKEFGIFSPMHLSGDGKNLDSRFSYYLSRFGNRYLTNMLFRGEKPKAVYEVGFVNAAIWLLPISTIQRCGGFDPIFGHYGEDEDYVQRLSFYKLKAGVVPAALAIHDRPQKFEITETDDITALNRNKLLILFKNPGKSLFRHFVSFSATHVVVSFNILLRRTEKGMKEHLKFYVMALGNVPRLYKSRKISYKTKLPFIQELVNGN
jgi:GT2 family glycosyltransferase